jgi:hypothetical protein
MASGFVPPSRLPDEILRACGQTGTTLSKSGELCMKGRGQGSGWAQI